jgi:hypothetical protein
MSLVSRGRIEVGPADAPPSRWPPHAGMTGDCHHHQQHSDWPDGCTPRPRTRPPQAESPM